MIVVTGTGGSGTSFLAELLRACGFDIGAGESCQFDGKTGGEDQVCEAINGSLNRGVPVDPEILCAVAACREVAKGPHFLSALRLWLEAGAAIEHVVVMHRAVSDAAQSFTARGFEEADGPIPLAERIHRARMRLGMLLTDLTLHAVPTTSLVFPRCLHRPADLYRDLPFLRPKLDVEAFEAAFTSVARPGQIESWKA